MYKLRTAFGLGLEKHVFPVVRDRVFADGEVVGYLLGEHTLRDESEDFSFPLREQVRDGFRFIHK